MKRSMKSDMRREQPNLTSVKPHLTDKRTQCLSFFLSCSFVAAHVKERFLALFLLYYIRMSELTSDDDCNFGQRNDNFQ